MELRRRQAARPAGTPLWLLELGDADYAAEMKRRAET
jgi:hypothetical protein